MESDKIYIHYGHSKFEREKFRKITNIPMFVKPHGGLWASPVDAKLGWCDWCTREHFVTERLNTSFRFKLSEDSKVLHIRSLYDLAELGDLNLAEMFHVGRMWCWLDFERLLEVGYDAIELHLSDEDKSNVGVMDGLYWRLYGWDCDSILVMNPDVIEVLE